MGSIKDNYYLEEERKISQLCRAAAHPARVKIIDHLLSNQMGCRNTDLAKWLKFSKPTVKHHIDFMKEAELIQVDYFLHYYNIRLNEKGIEFALKILS